MKRWSPGSHVLPFDVSPHSYNSEDILRVKKHPFPSAGKTLITLGGIQIIFSRQISHSPSRSIDQRWAENEANKKALFWCLGTL